jgi:hypothetical protein
MKASNWEIMANPPLNDKRYIEIVTTRPTRPHPVNRSKPDPAEHFRLNRYK